MKSLEELIKDLPPDLRKAVEDFVRSLIEKRVRPQEGRLRQDWAGVLRDYRGQYTSLDLQRKALEWRGD